MAVRKLEVQFLGEDRSASRTFGAVDDAADRTESKMSKWSNKIAGFVGAAFATGAIISWGSTLIDAAEESMKVTAQTEAVITSMGNAANLTAEDIGDLAEAISLKTGLDDEMIQSGENVLLTFGNIRDEVGEGNQIFTRATEVATDMSVAMGQDLQSSVVQVGKALNDPIAGLTALSRVGVQFTDDQKNMIAMMVVAGDTMGAQKVILGELERQFGGSAEAQATASDKLRVAWGNVQEQLGMVLLPLFESVATWLSEHLPAAIDTAITFWEKHRTVVEGAAIAVGVVLVGALIAYTVAAAQAAIATLAATWPILLIIAVVAALAFGLYYAYENWGWFRVGVQNAIDILGRIIGILREAVSWVDRLANALRVGGGAFGLLGGLAGGGNELTGGGGGGKDKFSPEWGFAEGGVVPGPVGAPHAAIVHGGETVVPYGAGGMGGGGDTYITVNVDGSVLTDSRALVDVINDALAGGYRLQIQGRGL